MRTTRTLMTAMSFWAVLMTLTAIGFWTVVLTTPVYAVPPTVEYIGDGTHVVTFTSPASTTSAPTKRRTTTASSDDALVSHDVKGKIVGMVTRQRRRHRAGHGDRRGPCKTVERHHGDEDQAQRRRRASGTATSMKSTGSKRTEVHGIGAACDALTSTPRSSVREAKLPFSEKYTSRSAASGGGGPRRRRSTARATGRCGSS